MILLLQKIKIRQIYSQAIVNVKIQQIVKSKSHS